MASDQRISHNVYYAIRGADAITLHTQSVYTHVDDILTGEDGTDSDEVRNVIRMDVPENDSSRAMTKRFTNAQLGIEQMIRLYYSNPADVSRYIRSTDEPYESILEKRFGYRGETSSPLMVFKEYKSPFVKYTYSDANIGTFNGVVENGLREANKDSKVSYVVILTNPPSGIAADEFYGTLEDSTFHTTRETEGVRYEPVGYILHVKGRHYVANVKRNQSWWVVDDQCYGNPDCGFDSLAKREGEHKYVNTDTPEGVVISKDGKWRKEFLGSAEPHVIVYRKIREEGGEGEVYSFKNKNPTTFYNPDVMCSYLSAIQIFANLPGVVADVFGKNGFSSVLIEEEPE